MKPTAWYDKSCGAFYISARTIPDNVFARGALVPLYDNTSQDELVSALKAYIELGHSYSYNDIEAAKSKAFEALSKVDTK